MFQGTSKLQEHNNADHVGLRPFECEQCEKTFPYTNGLTEHVKSVHHERKKKTFMQYLP